MHDHRGVGDRDVSIRPQAGEEQVVGAGQISTIDRRIGRHRREVRDVRWEIEEVLTGEPTGDRTRRALVRPDRDPAPGLIGALREQGGGEAGSGEEREDVARLTRAI